MFYDSKFPIMTLDDESFQPVLPVTDELWLSNVLVFLNVLNISDAYFS